MARDLGIYLKIFLTFISLPANRYLVDFRGKTADEREEERDGGEWVEYEDALGRSRTCLKNELPDLVKNDKELYKYKEEEARKEREKAMEEKLSYDMMSEDMRRELLRQKWEKEEEENLNKRSVHYQDVLFDEARTHGAGFYRYGLFCYDAYDTMRNILFTCGRCVTTAVAVNL